MRQLIISISTAIIFLACSSEHKKNHANEHMHQSSFEDLVKRFEDSTRASWQKPNELMAFMKLNANDVVADIGAG
ncbi:MAG: hypothetical protein ACPGLV_07195, partial [Bacteroidia bacterium]